LEKRINEHNDGLNPESYTYTRKPVELVFYYEFNDVNQAIGFEKQIKGWSRKKKEAIINDNWELLPELSKNKMKD
jgi:putative endonuclease